MTTKSSSVSPADNKPGSISLAKIVSGIEYAFAAVIGIILGIIFGWIIGIFSGLIPFVC